MKNVGSLSGAKAGNKESTHLVETIETLIETFDNLSSVDLMDLENEKRCAAIETFAKAKIGVAFFRPDVQAAVAAEVSRLERTVDAEESMAILRDLAPEAFAVRLI
jgi:hypothetical protein